jgi:hypothetical protein
MIKLFISLLLFFGNITIALNDTWAGNFAEDIEQESPLKLHVIYSENIQEIMHRLSLSVYEDELSM